LTKTPASGGPFGFASFALAQSTLMTMCRTLALILAMSASLLGAQGDFVAPRIRPDGGGLSPVVLTYVATLQRGMDIRPLGERTVQLAKTTYGGLSAWEIVETRGAGASASVDSLIVDYLTLAPFHWGATQPMPALTGGMPPIGARVSVEFRSDTMFGVMTSPTGRKNLLMATQPGAYITAAHFEVALRGLPIAAPNWRDSTWLLLTGLGKTSSVPADMRVTGEEKLVTTAGSFDCWIVSLTTELGATQYWVSKTDRIVVQSTQVVPETGAVLQYQLSRISH
jgi:hypothetical protein